MSGGSVEAEGPHDKQCPHCELYYQDKGVSFQMHAAACSEGEEQEDTESTEADENGTQSGTEDTSTTEDPTMGSGDVPSETQETELPCGHESINLDEFDSGTWIKCDSCEKKYKLS